MEMIKKLLLLAALTSISACDLYGDDGNSQPNYSSTTKNSGTSYNY